MREFSVEDIILANKIAKFLHATIGEEGKLWRTAQAPVGKATVFSVAEDNAFSFTMKVFDNDPRITVLQPREAGFYGTLRSAVGSKCPAADGTETNQAKSR